VVTRPGRRTPQREPPRLIGAHLDVAAPQAGEVFRPGRAAAERVIEQTHVDAASSRGGKILREPVTVAIAAHDEALDPDAFARGRDVGEQRSKGCLQRG